nr:immunoglobulin light chain junction region [Macaca mulatta]MOX33303.1 immunoglobulin light chain junction region [Macaca mulatta]MOX34444.1 immunoglobulin light chain junction region [Macaca mulatta]MOX34487.1 immunoglobulin light chain junction region [Macaca mulatta]MOX34732.1 immunoglobulin light chain junction region [Macaca mulatta]
DYYCQVWDSNTRYVF